MSDGIELTAVEKLAVAQAFYKAVGSLVSTKDPDSLRGKADEYFKELYDQTGAKSFDVKLLGGKVGTFSVKTSKPTESVEKVELVVDDGDELFRWAVLNGCVKVDMKAVEALFRDTGEVPDGCSARKVHVPGSAGGVVTGTALKVDENLVLDALGMQLESVSRALLMEGGD